jgi:hypothetical protein
VSARQLLALALGLLAAATGSAVAPTHPVYNPPVGKYILGAMAFTAAMFAREAARWPRKADRDPDDLKFVVSFDDRGITRANPDGTTDSARWCDLERISIDPDDDPLLWTGPYFVYLTFRSGPLAVPASAEGLKALMERLLELPGIDREGLEALMRGASPSPCVLWSRENGA